MHLRMRYEDILSGIYSTKTWNKLNIHVVCNASSMALLASMKYQTTQSMMPMVFMMERKHNKKMAPRAGIEARTKDFFILWELLKTRVDEV